MSLSIPKIKLPDEREIRISGTELKKFLESYASHNSPKDYRMSFVSPTAGKNRIEASIYYNGEGKQQIVTLKHEHIQAVLTAALSEEGLTLTAMKVHGSGTEHNLIIEATAGPVTPAKSTVKPEDPFNL